MTKKLIIGKLWPSILFFFLAIKPAVALTIPRVSAKLINDRVAIGETVLLTVTVTWIGPASAFLFLPPQPPECRGLTVTGTAQRCMVYRTDGDLHQVREYLFTLVGDVEGSGRVGPVRLLYRRGGEEEEHSLTTEPLEVPVAPGGEGFFTHEPLLHRMGKFLIVYRAKDAADGRFAWRQIFALILVQPAAESL